MVQSVHVNGLRLARRLRRDGHPCGSKASGRCDERLTDARMGPKPTVCLRPRFDMLLRGIVSPGTLRVPLSTVRSAGGDARRAAWRASRGRGGEGGAGGSREGPCHMGHMGHMGGGRGRNMQNNIKRAVVSRPSGSMFLQYRVVQ